MQMTLYPFHCKPLLKLQVNKIEEEKSGILASLEQKDATLHDVQRKLEVGSVVKMG